MTDIGLENLLVVISPTGMRSEAFFFPPHRKQAKSHTLPLFVLGREATGLVTDFCWHRPAGIVMPRKNPALCEFLHVIPLQVVPACGTRSEITRSSLIRFKGGLRRAGLTAMNYCSQFRMDAANDCRRDILFACVESVFNTISTHNDNI